MKSWGKRGWGIESLYLGGKKEGSRNLIQEKYLVIDIDNFRFGVRQLIKKKKLLNF